MQIIYKDDKGNQIGFPKSFICGSYVVEPY